MKNKATDQSRRIIQNTYSNFKWNFKGVIFFEVLYKLIALLLVIPLNYYILEKSIMKTGVHHVTNKELVAFGMTFPGIIAITLIVLISFIAIFIEMAVLVYMANASHKQQKASLWEAVINCVKITPRVPSIYMILIVLLSGVLGPLTGVGLYNSLLKRLSIPSFVKIELFKSFGGKVVFGVFMVLVILIVLRWLLCIPTIIIEKVSLKEAFKRGAHIYKTSRFKIMYYLMWWLVVNYMIRMLLLVVYLAAGTGVIFLLGYTSVLSKYFIGAYLILFLIGYTIISVMTLPLFISFLVELYYEYRDYEVTERVFAPITEYRQKKVYSILEQYGNTFSRVVLTLFCVMVSMMAIVAIFDRVIDKKILVTAHRGSSRGTPENSVASITQAIFEGADYAEIDVMTTKDNRVVLFHDATLKRIAGSDRRIKDMTLDEAKQVDNGSYFHPSFSGERIPTLAEILEMSKGKIKLNIELKPVGKDDQLAKRVAELIKEYEMTQEVVVSSLEYDAIKQFKQYSPLVKIGYIMSFGLGDLTQLDVDFISVEYDLLTRELVYAMNALGKEVHVWTINDQERVRDVARLRVDNVITDEVPMVQKTLNSLERKDIHYLTWFYDSVTAIMRYVSI